MAEQVTPPPYAENEARVAPRRRRPGRWRRWFLRPVVWVLALLVSAIGGLGIYLGSEAASRRLRDFLVARGSELLEVPVSLSHASLSLSPLAIELTDLVLPGSDGEPWVVVPHGRIELSLDGLRSPRLTIRSVWLEAPRVMLRIEADENGKVKMNLPPGLLRPAAEGSSPSRLEIRVGTLAVEHGAFVLNDREVPLDLDAREIEAMLEGRGSTRSGLEIDGRVQVAAVEVVLPDAHPFKVALRGEVTLSESGIAVRAAQIEGEDLRAGATGSYRWAGQGQPDRLDLEFSGEGDLRWIGRVGYLASSAAAGSDAPPIAGTVAFTGRLRGEFPGRWGIEADVSSPSVVVVGRQLDDLAARIEVDSSRVRGTLQAARFADGDVRGEVIVGLGSKRISPTAEALPPLDVNLEIEGVDAIAVLRELGVPLTGLAARARGTLRYRIDDLAQPFGGSGLAELKLVPPLFALENDQLALAGDVELVVVGGSLTADRIELTAPEQSLLLEGLVVRLSNGRGGFDLAVRSENVGLLALLLPGFDPAAPPPPWMPTRGRGTIDGSLQFGGEVGVSAEMNLDLTEVQAPGVAADSVRGVLVVDADAVERLDLTLAKGGGAAVVQGRVPFAAAGIDLHIEPRNWLLSDARGFLPFELPIEGGVSGRIDLSGSADVLSGAVDIRMPAPRELGGVPLDALEAKLRFDPEQVWFDDVRLSLAGGTIRGRGTLGLGDGEEADLAIETVEPLDIESLLPGGPLTGKGRVTGRIGGTLESPRTALRVDSRGVTLAGRPLPDGELDLALEGAELRASGSLLGLVRLDGGGRIDGEQLALEFGVDIPDLAPLGALGLSSAAGDVGGRAQGRISASGTLKEPRLDLRLDPLTLTYGRLVLRNLEPVVAAWKGRRLEIETVYLGDPSQRDSEIFVGGGIDFERAATLDLHLQATLPAGWLNPFPEDLDLAGTVNALANVRGQLDRLDLDGQADWTEERIPLDRYGLPHSAEDVHALFLADSQEIVLKRLAARFASGEVTMSGRVRLPSPGMPLDYALNLEGRDIHLRWPVGWDLEADASLALAPSVGGRILNGEIRLARGQYLENIPVNVFDLLRSLARRQRLEVASTDPFETSTELLLEIKAPGTLRVTNNVANLRATTNDLTIKGTLARPVLVGEVRAESGGKLVYGETEYEIERGLLTFASLQSLDPVIDLLARTRVREYEIHLNLSGTLERLNASFVANPPLPDVDVLALLTTGDRLANSGDLTSALLPQGQQGGAGGEVLLYGQASSLVASRFKGLFGLDRFRIDPTASTGGSVDSARLVFGKQISRDLFVTYQRDLSSNQDQLVRVEWQIEPGLLLVLTNTDGSRYAVDVQWERRF